MTEERNRPNAATEADAFVTRTYRGTVVERTPEHLDKAVLDQAARAARPRYAGLRAWTRPMAWAATIMLCFALVLEVGRVPAPVGIDFEQGAGKIEAQPRESEMADDAPAEAFEESIHPQTPSGRPSNIAIEAPSQVAPIKSTQSEAASPPTFRKKQPSNAARSQTELRQTAASTSGVDELKVRDKDILQQAEDMARVQSEDDRGAEFADAAAGAVSADAAILGNASIDAVAPGCDESEQATPETWLACIAGLEEAGMAAEATRQQQQLSETFPEFDAP